MSIVSAVLFWCAMVAVIIVAGMLAADASAAFRPGQFSPPPHDPTAAQIAACAPDAARLCASAIPDHEAVRFCMLRHKRQVSKECKDAFK